MVGYRTTVIILIILNCLGGKMSRKKEENEDKSKSKSQQRKHQSKSIWELEQEFDRDISLEELMASPPFKEASDEAGSFTAGTRIPSWLQRRIIYYTEVRGSPYQIQSDVIRDALWLGLRIIATRHRGNVEWTLESKMSRAIEKVHTIQRIRTQINSLVSGLDSLVSEKDVSQAVQGLEEYISPVFDFEDEWHKYKVVSILMENKVIRSLIDRCSNDTQVAVQKILDTGERVNR